MDRSKLLIFGEIIWDVYSDRACIGLDKLKVLGLPVLSGTSRKTMIYKLTGGDPTTALNGTTVLNTISLMKGASILRVHDVREAVETVKIYNATNPDK